MHDDVDTTNEAAMAPPPPPPPPPPAQSRRRVIGRRGAAVAVASGLVVGGVAGGYVISQAATSAPTATASPAPGGTAPFGPRDGRPGFPGGGGPAARTQDLQQAAAALGITTAQLQTEMSAGKTIAAIATEHHVAVATLISTLVADENSEIDAALKAGSVTSAQAAQMKANTTQRVTDMVNGTRPAGGFPGHGGPGGMRAEDQQVIATAVGITTTQLQTELSAGKTVAAIATEHNVTAATVISALVSSENTEIDQRVSSGQLTAAQAAQERTQTQQRVTDSVNGTRPAGGPWGHPGPDGGAPPGAPSGSSSTN